MTDTEPSFPKQARQPYEEALALVRAMRANNQGLLADVLERGFEDLRLRTTQDVSQVMIRVLREHGKQDLAESIEKRLGELWGTGYERNLDNYYG